MMRGIDLTSWQSILSTILGVALFALIGIGIRLLMMVLIQQRRERMNRQINERLKALIAAYKTLGGSFTGSLEVDPTHLRDIRARQRAAVEAALASGDPMPDDGDGSDRARRIRDAVENALSDIILLGTEEQVKLAAAAARDLVEGRPVHTHDLVVSLRDFIREALDLDPVPPSLDLPRQGPTRPSGSGGKGGGGRSGGEGGGGRGAGGGGGGGGMGGSMAAGGMGMGMGAGLSLGAHKEDET